MSYYRKPTPAELAFRNLLIAATHYAPMSQDELYRRRVEIEHEHGGYDHWVNSQIFGDGNGRRARRGEGATL